MNSLPKIRRAERTEFENFARGAALDTDRFGNYLNASVDFAFRAWCRRAQMPSENERARWIDTADFLPETGQPVLVCCTDGAVIAACRTETGWLSVMIDSVAMKPRDVTFWQPWPQLPAPRPLPAERKVKW